MTDDWVTRAAGRLMDDIDTRALAEEAAQRTGDRLRPHDAVLHRDGPIP